VMSYCSRHDYHVIIFMNGVKTKAVVNKNVDPAGPGGEVAKPRHPLAQLVLAIGIPEALGRAGAGLVPRRRVAAVEADHREHVGGRRRHRWHAGARTLRLVDRHVHEAAAAEEVERALAPRLRHPPGLAEL